MLSGKQSLETFTTAITTCTCDKLNRCIKLLGEMLEFDSAFMLYMKDDAGMISDPENLAKVRSPARILILLDKIVFSLADEFVEFNNDVKLYF